MTRWQKALIIFINGLILGAGWMLLPAGSQTTSRPPFLAYGRTSGGVNVPILVDSSGVVKTVGGGGGSPGGMDTQVQFNNMGAFGGSANLTWNGSVLGATSATLSAVNALNFTAADTAYITATNWLQIGPGNGELGRILAPMEDAGDGTLGAWFLVAAQSVLGTGGVANLQGGYGLTGSFYTQPGTVSANGGLGNLSGGSVDIYSGSGTDDGMMTPANGGDINLNPQPGVNGGRSGTISVNGSLGVTDDVVIGGTTLHFVNGIYTGAN